MINVDGEVRLIRYLVCALVKEALGKDEIIASEARQSLLNLKELMNIVGINSQRIINRLKLA